MASSSIGSPPWLVVTLGIMFQRLPTSYRLDIFTTTFTRCMLSLRGVIHLLVGAVTGENEVAVL